MKTAITELLNIEYPVLMGGMQWISKGEFVAAVAEAGGTGFIPSATCGSKNALISEIEKARSITKKPFGVNISMLPDASPDSLEWVVETVLEQKIPFVETSGRSPAELVPYLKKEGIKILHKVTFPQHALRAAKDGVDAVILVGYEGGGHPGMKQIGTFVNLPATADALDIPVVAAGGICDRKTFAAALLLGAEGVMMGTRMIATKECPVHENFKQWILDSGIDDTLIIQRSIRNAFRAVNNKKAQQVLGLEQTGIGLKELLPHISGQLGKQAIENGDMENAVLSAGQCCGRIKQILSVKEVIEDMVKGAEDAAARLNNLK